MSGLRDEIVRMFRARGLCALVLEGDRVCARSRYHDEGVHEFGRDGELEALQIETWRRWQELRPITAGELVRELGHFPEDARIEISDGRTASKVLNVYGHFSDYVGSDGKRIVHLLGGE